MNSGKTGIAFKEMMSGGFALGETDPAAGAAKGKDSVLVMHGTVTIDDIDRFIGDSSHGGVLDVVMDWPPLGTGPVVGAGIISLSFEELIKMGGNFKPLNAPSPEAGAAAVARFGKFFMGELWDTYVTKART
jgi:hypothetical protein